MFSHSNTVSLFFRRDVTVGRWVDRLLYPQVLLFIQSPSILRLSSPKTSRHQRRRRILPTSTAGICMLDIVSEWSNSGKMRWDEFIIHAFVQLYIYIFYINIYDYIVANHRIICSMYSNHKDQFITTLWTCLYSFLSSGLEVAAEFGWSKWPRCCGHLGSGATEDPGIFGNVGSAEFLQPFLGSFEFYPWQSKFPGSMKLRIDRGSSAYSLWVSGSIPGPSEVCNGRRIDLQADLSSAGNRSASANNRSSPDTEQHLRNYLSTSKSHFHIWTPIWSYLRFRLGSTSGYYLIQCDKPNKPSPSPCLWVLC